MYEHLLSWIALQPWAIEQAKAAEILAVLAARLDGDEEAIEAQRMHPTRERAVRESDGSVALIPIHGVMAQRRMPGASTGGGVSTDEAGVAIDKAAADPQTKAIVLDFDTPGGAVVGTREFAAKVRRARDAVPVIAQINSLAASAGYWAASQATEIVSTPGGRAGSIGVLAVHEDVSAMLAEQGIKRTIISAGKYKAEGNPFGPLSEETLAHMQATVDEAYADFVGAVAGGRGVTTKVVESSYGQGRMMGAAQALRAGMVDRIGTLEETLARFAPRPTYQRRARAASAIART